MSNLLVQPVNSLDEDPPITKPLTKTVILELTINHPRTKPFCRMSRDAQKSLLTSLYYKARSTVPYRIIEDVCRHEVSQDGTIHLHAFIVIDAVLPFYPKGLVMEAARAVIHAMPVRTYQQLAKYHYHNEFKVFKSPAVLAQLTDGDDKKRTSEWCDYINKNYV